MPHFTMNQLHCWISSWVLLLCLAVSTCSEFNIGGFEGQDVTLPCKYDSSYHGGCHICWMRGNIPLTGCGDQILYANEEQVLERASVRYLLNGELQRGDASLTIRNASQNDTGKYSCRVHIPGWFNDKKVGVYLSIKATPQTTTLGSVTTTTTSSLTHATPQTTTLGPVTTTTTSSLTHGPASTQHHETTTNYPTTISETVTTNTGPVPTQHHETTTNYSTTSSETATTNTGPDSITNETENTVNVTTNNTVSGADEPFKENSVKEATYLFPVIWVPVILILLGVGISSFYLIRKHRRRLRSTLEIAKISSAFVSYNNFDDSVILPIDNENPFKN